MILTLGLGIGANTTVFSLMERRLLRSLLPEPARLMVVTEFQNAGFDNFSWPDYLDVEQETQSFSALAAVRSGSVSPPQGSGTLLLVTATLGRIGLIACLIPALRAAQVDPGLAHAGGIILTNCANLQGWRVSNKAKRVIPQSEASDTKQCPSASSLPMTSPTSGRACGSC